MEGLRSKIRYFGMTCLAGDVRTGPPPVMYVYCSSVTELLEVSDFPFFFQILKKRDALYCMLSYYF